jgi:hypothetical protein
VRRPKAPDLDPVRRRLRGVRYAVSDVVFVAGRVIARVVRAIGSGVGGFWSGLSTEARGRFVAALGVAAALALLLAVAVPNLPCQAPGGDACPPPDDAEELVPADALAYVHANLDPETEQYGLAGEASRSVPLVAGQIVARALALVPGAAGVPAAFETEVLPWFGGEAAVAVVGSGGGAATQVELLEVRDARRATEYAASIAAGRPEVEDHRGVVLTTDQRGLATAQVDDFLVIGEPAGVRVVIDVATGADGATSLAADSAAQDLRDELPDDRLVEAYVSEEGVDGLIAGDRGALGSLAPVVAPGASLGAAAALVASEGGFELAIRSSLDPERAQSSPGFFAAFPGFEPELPEILSERSLAYVGFGEPRATVSALLAQASAQAPAIATGFDDLFARLRHEGGVDLERELLEALGSEAAFALEPRPGEDGALPYLELVAAGIDEERARRALGSLQGALAAAVDPGSDLQAPVYGEAEIEGVEARSLRLSATVEITTAVFDGLAVIATDPAAIGRLARGEGGLDRSPVYERATEDLGEDEEVSLLAFLDLGELVAVAEQLGLAEDPAYATFAGEFRRLEALGLAVESSDDLLATDVRLLLSEAEAEDPAAESADPASD